MDAWIISLTDDAQVDKAVVLGMSLRRVRTSKKLVSQVAPKVSNDARKRLRSIFDFVVPLESLEVEEGVDRNMGIVSSKLFRKYVFLDATSMVVVNNCDDLFDKHDFIGVGVRLEDGGGAVVLEVDRKYVAIVNLEDGGTPDWQLMDDMRIFNFTKLHPLDWKGNVEFSAEVEFAVDLCKSLLSEADERNAAPHFVEPWPKFDNESIAIVGMSFRLPGGNNADDFWQLLIEGREAIKPVPEHRWLPEQTGTYKIDRSVEAGFIDSRVDEVDSRLFGWSATEVNYLDPQQVLLHEVAWEALEHAGVDPFSLRSTQTGVFVGTWAHDFRSICSKTPDADHLRLYLGNSVASTSARLSHFLGTTGPSFGYDSGCASTLTALHSAVVSLRRRECHLGLVGGANLLLKPFTYEDLDIVLSKRGRCSTFDATADGFGRAEGVATLVLKRLPDAVRDKDRILALIRGNATTQEGASKSLSTPTVETEALAIKLALHNAGVFPKDVSVVEAHGTGTPVGDPIEVAAIQKAYSTERINPLLIGSVKTNIGHTEAVSGLAGIIKIILSMKHEMLPPHRNLTRLNPQINLEAIPAHIPTLPVPWPRNKMKRRLAGVSSFGISGTDVHAIIEEPPQSLHLVIPRETERPLHILQVSAKVPAALQELLESYATLLEKRGGNGASIMEVGTAEIFADIAYTANTTRAKFLHRAIIIANDSVSAARIIRSNAFQTGQVKASATSSLCFLFTGQGSQYPGMAQELYATSPVFKMNFGKCDKILQTRYNIHLKDVLWSHDNATSEVDLRQTLYSQTSIFCVEYCLLQLWLSWGVHPDAVLGHSLGEFCAAVAASALSFEDALMLVVERSRLIEGFTPRGKMLVIKADQNSVQNLIDEFTTDNSGFWVDFAAFNSYEQTVIAGDLHEVEAFAKFCGGKGVKTVMLASNHAFHSRHMNPILEKYRKTLATVKFPPQQSTSIPRPVYISGLEGKVVAVESLTADYWVRHAVEPVRFAQACKAMATEVETCKLFLEMGPHPVLSTLTKSNLIDNSVLCLPSLCRLKGDWVTLLESVAKLVLSTWKGSFNWRRFDAPYHRQKRLDDLPKYPFQRQRADRPRGVVEPREIHPLLGHLLPTLIQGQFIFQTEMTLRRAAFAEDHVFGLTVIFPGSAFLEMVLHGGYAATSTETNQQARSLYVKNLNISSPLALIDPDFSTVQTVVTELEDEDNYALVSIGSHRTSDSTSADRWTRHVTNAKFSTVIPSNIMSLSLVNWTSVIATWPEVETQSFYDEMSKAGVHFGPNFRSLATCWRHDNGNEFVYKVNHPQNEMREKRTHYLAHPVVTDAMIQTFILLRRLEVVGAVAKNKILIPVKIGEFALLHPSFIATSTNQLYIHTWTDEEGEGHSTLRNESGTTLAYMGKVELVETTAKALEHQATISSKVASATSDMPQTWEEVWRNMNEVEQVLNLENFGHHLQICDGDMTAISAIGTEELSLMKCWNKLSALYILKALYRLWWIVPELGAKFTVDEVISSLQIREKHSNYLTFWFDWFASPPHQWLNRVATANGSIMYEIVQAPPSLSEVEKMILERGATNDLNYARAEYKKVVEVAQDLASVLKGAQDELEVVFPREERGKTAVETYYAGILKVVKPPIEHSFRLLLSKISSLAATTSGGSKSEGRVVIRMLEVGAGTGTITKLFLDLCAEILGNDKTEVEYTFTDISTKFFAPAHQLLGGGRSSKVVFRKFDMDADPLHQGLVPNQFDLVIACEALHVAKNLRTTLSHLHTLLKPGGGIYVIEDLKPNPRNFFVFGLLDGYWHFDDPEVRQVGPLVVEGTWRELLHSKGFTGTSCVPVRDGELGLIFAVKEEIRKTTSSQPPPQFSWLILEDGHSKLENRTSELLKSKLEGIGRKVYVASRYPGGNTGESCDEMEARVRSHLYRSLKVAERGTIYGLEGVIYSCGLETMEGTRDQRWISLPLLTLCQTVALFEKQPKIVVLTRGAFATHNDDVVSSPSAAATRSIVRGIWNEKSGGTSAPVMRHLDLDSFTPLEEQVEPVFSELWTNTNGQVAFRSRNSGLLRLKPQLVQSTTLKQDQLLPLRCKRGGRFQLELPRSKLISDLEFIPLEKGRLSENEVEVVVKAVGLNFRDVFTVLKPSEAFVGVNTLGVDISGVVSQVGTGVTRWHIGDRVVGLNINSNFSLPSHLNFRQESVVELPKTWTLWEGATAPTAFFTAYQCLIVVGKLKAGETVLIHTASGGVGLVAIQLCRQLGVNIVATAGSERKRAYLHKILGVPHVFNSRTTEFSEQILEMTGGGGVHLVLNSLTGEGFKEASLAALGRGGRFVEMSKLNVWSPEEVECLRPDVCYTIVDVATLPPPQLEVLYTKLKEYMEKEKLAPIPFERWDALNIRAALSHLRKAAHIGKVVCVMPEVGMDSGGSLKEVFTTPLFNSDSTYLVTGGLSGIGFEVVKWIIENGGRHIVIVSRREKPPPEIETQMESWNNGGNVKVCHMRADVSSDDQVGKLLQELSGWPPVRGIFHSAGVLSDGMLSNQTWSKFQVAYGPKVEGTWNLHDLTVNSFFPLEYFVVFSSIASLFASIGQMNHSTANCFQDALIAHRHSLGLPGTAVNWGQWGEVGVATGITLPGIQPFSTAQGLQALDSCLRTHTQRVAVADVRSFVELQQIAPFIKHYVEDKTLLLEEFDVRDGAHNEGPRMKLHISPEQFWKEFDSCQSRMERLEVVQGLIHRVLVSILKLSSANSERGFDAEQDFASQGVDSLVMLEFRNLLQKGLGSSRLVLTQADLQSAPSPRKLASKLIEKLETKNASGKHVNE